MRFTTFQDVQDFVSLATAQSFPIVVGSGDYQVNGTSFMGMFSLDYTKPLTVTVNCTQQQLEDFRREAARFLDL